MIPVFEGMREGGFFGLKITGGNGYILPGASEKASLDRGISSGEK